MLLRLLFKLIQKLFASAIKHRARTIAMGVGAGVAAGAAGAAAAHSAKKINSKALEIQNEAIALHDTEYEKVQNVLNLLGEVEKTAIDSFTEFADTVEKIQGRPKMKTGIFSAVKLPNYTPQDLKALSNNLNMAVVGIGGAGAGTLVGLAAFGVNAVVAAPAAVVGGVVICVKGFNMRNKAIENVRQAKQMRKSVEQIIAFYSKLRESSDKFRLNITSVYTKYREHLDHLNQILTMKSVWWSFSREEKRIAENTVMLARLLYEMCKTNIVVKAETDKMETINETELLRLEKQSQKLLTNI